MEEFAGLLQAHGVKRLVDVRSFPRSRRNPRFNLDALPGSLRVRREAMQFRGLGRIGTEPAGMKGCSSLEA